MEGTVMPAQDLFVALHKEFDNKHHIITTQFGEPESFDECKEVCAKLNKNGFNYLPYKFPTYGSPARPF